MKSTYLFIAASLISFAVHAGPPVTLKIDVRCGILARPSIVDVDSIYINGDILTNHDTNPYSQIPRGGFLLKVIGNKLLLSNLKDGSRISIGTVEQETECSNANFLETFGVNQSNRLEVKIETGPSQCMVRKIDDRIEYFWMAIRSFKFTDKMTNQEATFSTVIQPNDDPSTCN